MAIVLVQATSGGAKFIDGSATTMQLDFGVNVTAGNFVVALVGCWNAASGAITATMTGETFSEYHKDDTVGSGLNGRGSILYFGNATGGAKVLTITSAGASGDTFLNGIAYEFSGVATSSFTDSHNPTTAASTSTTISSGALTPDVGNSLFVGIGSETTSNPAYTDTTTGFTLAFNQTGAGGGGHGQGGIAWYKIAADSNAQTASATFSTTGDDRWYAAISAFKPVSAAGRTTKNTSTNPLGMELGMNLWGTLD